MSDIEGNEPLVGAEYLELRRTDVVGACAELADRANSAQEKRSFILNGITVYANPGDGWRDCFNRWLTERNMRNFDMRRYQRMEERRVQATWNSALPSSIISVRQEPTRSRRIILFDAD